MDLDDYLSARKAMRHFNALGDPRLSSEYRELCDELAQVLMKHINRNQ